MQESGALETASTPHRTTVLHVIDKLSMDHRNPSSCTKLLADWAAYHDPERFQVHVCCLQRDAGGAYLEHLGYGIHYIELGKISPLIARRILGLIRRLDVDIVHLHGYASANYGRIAARLSGTPNVVHEHGILRILPHQFVVDRLLRNMTDHGVAISRAVQEFMIRGRSVPADRIEVVYNGIELDRFRVPAAERIQEFRARWGIAPDRRVVGTVTRLFEIKGNRYFIEAMPRIAAQYPEVVFLIAGDGPERRALEDLAGTLGLGADRLIFTGWVDDVTATLAAMDLVIVSSLREGLSLVVLESMAAGKGIVASRVGGIVELLESGESGWLVPPADPAALAGAIAALLDDPDRTARLARGALTASARFSVENNVLVLEDLYDRILATRRS